MQRKLYTPSGTEDECSCPIHREGNPPTLPLGIRFSSRIEVEEIPDATAGTIYEAHHSYMPNIPEVNKVSHGILLDGQLVGAITWRHPLMNCIGSDTTDRYGLSRQYGGEEVIEASRICIGVPMKNLASASLAASQDKFIADYVVGSDLNLLLTFIRIDHTGSMLKALLDKGWFHGGISTPSTAGNREHKEIREWKKIRWLNEIGKSTKNESVLEQTTIGEFQTPPAPA